MYKSRVLIACLTALGLLALAPVFLSGQLNRKTIYSTDRIEKELLDWVNKERKAQGRSPLQSHPVLGEVALAHSQKMAGERKLKHRFPGYKTLTRRLMAAGVYFLESGENIAFSESVVGKYIHREFMKSTGHRRNILDPSFTHCGIKLARRKNDFYVTQVFAGIYDPMSPVEVETYLEKELQSFSRNKNSKPLTLFEHLRPYARIAAGLHARNGNVNVFMKSLPDTWGRIFVTNMVAARPELLLKEFTGQLGRNHYSGAAIGVSPVRNDTFPGGAYAVSVFFLNLVRDKWTIDEFRVLLLDTLNRERETKDLPPLTLDDRFTRMSVDRLEKNFGAREDRFKIRIEEVMRGMGRQSIRTVYFKTDNPGVVPQDVRAALSTADNTSGAGSGKILILVSLPKDEGQAANYFRVVIVY